MCGAETQNDLVAGLRAEVAELRAAVVALTEANVRLEALLDESRRGGKRQAAPFSKGVPIEEPKSPGRKKGALYGKRASRPIPDHVDREVDVLLPDDCPHCGGMIVADAIHDQFVCEVPKAMPEVTRFRVHVGRCAGCRRRVQGHHREQHSRALGAGGVQLGPRALSIGHLLHYSYGLSFARAAAVLSEMFGLPVARSALCRGAASTAVALAPTQAAIEKAVNNSAMVVADETGWKVAGRKAWLWVATSRDVTAYRITKGRRYKDLTPLLHADYNGVLVRDGWAPYRKYVHATHQSCAAHLARRCHELREELPAWQRGFPNQISVILNEAFAWRDSERPAEQLFSELEVNSAGPLAVGGNNRVGQRDPCPCDS